MPCLPKILISGLIAGLPCLSPLAACAFEGAADLRNRPCVDCHACNAPTREAPCLRGCPRPHEVAPTPIPATATADIPDFFVLDQLSDLYGPVFFPHKLHADMEGMAQGCAVCHHHNPPGKILGCKECHGGPSNPEHLGQPGLKGAYHRQCLSCHREWSHETDCAVCHQPRENGHIIPVTPEATDIMGRLHPNVKPPGKWVYKTPDMPEGGVVTFHHGEHIQLFGLACVECHRKENCSRCHGGTAPNHRVRTDPHEDCSACHDVSDNCTRCHAQSETAGFEHGRRTGFSLKPYHSERDCAACHVGGKVFGGLSPDCRSCHAPDWMPEAFDHKLTGLELDELHQEASCADCHVAGLGKPVGCAGCHEDGKQYPETLPGKRVGDATAPGK